MDYNNVMAEITVSAERLQSMFDNRHKEITEVKKELNLKCDLNKVVLNDSVISFEDLEAIARYFKKPWSYLLIDEKELMPKFGHDNRTVENKKRPVSAEMVQELQAAELMLDTAIDIYPENSYKLPNISVAIDSVTDETAIAVRDFFKITIKRQLDCKDQYEALRLWSEAIQSTGIYVSQRRLVDENIRAFSIARKKHAVIVVSTRDSAYARIFSLLHEYCHVVMRNTGICDLSEVHNTLESLCNTFAAQVLLPDEMIKKELKGFSFAGDLDEDEKTVQDLSHHFRVSQAALLIRLKSVGLLQESYFNKLESKRRSRRRSNTGKGGDYYATAINKVGKQYAKDIFGALSDGVINRSDASAVLGVGEHIVSRFKDRLFNAPRATNE